MSAELLNRIPGGGVAAAGRCRVRRIRDSSRMSRSSTARPRCWSACAAASALDAGARLEDLTAAVARRVKRSRRAMRWALEALVIDHLTISCITTGLGVSWHTADDAALAEGKRVLIDDPGPVRRREGRRRRRARLAPHEVRGQVRHRHHRSHPGYVTRQVPRGRRERDRGRRDGRLHRLQD